MKKISYIVLALIAIFVNSTAYAVEARTPTRWWDGEDRDGSEKTLETLQLQDYFNDHQNNI